MINSEIKNEVKNNKETEETEEIKENKKNDTNIQIVEQPSKCSKTMKIGGICAGIALVVLVAYGICRLHRRYKKN
jgi:hypothetical protein